MADTIDKSNLKLNTPMMRQYMDIKRRFQNEILFFRMGDFYEMFLDDAVYASQILDIALTRRQDKIPMCGIPHHALTNYVHPILDSGRRIAICDQIEDPATVSGRIVKRDVTRILSAGTIFEEELLQQADRRLLAAILPAKNCLTQDVVLADLSTSELILQQLTINTNDLANQMQLKGLLNAWNVKELIVPQSFTVDMGPDIFINYRDYYLENSQAIEESLQQEFQVKNIDSFELTAAEKKSIYILLQYVAEIAPRNKLRFSRPQKEYKRKTLFLDESALKTLELLQSQTGVKNASLLAVLDFTQTAMGKRRLTYIIGNPSFDKTEIDARLDTLEFFINQKDIADSIAKQISLCHDLERILNHLSNKPQVRHLGQILETLQAIRDIHQILYNQSSLPPALKKDFDKLTSFPSELKELFTEALYIEDLPPVLDERRFINENYSDILDEAISYNQSAQTILANYEKNEKEKYEISTLKVRYNKVIGYFIEISKGLTHKAPSHYHRRQTLVNAERYTSDELKEIETKILNAKEDVLQLQRGIFHSLIDEVLKQSEALRHWARILAELDVSLSLTAAAKTNHYCRPEILKEGQLKITNGRHPVVEVLFKNEVFIPNDVLLDNHDRHLAILTGPNMSGKSTYIRQVGLIQIMAQIGSFVPADEAIIPLADRVFTRIGAYDRLFQGESTFYVEMAECARIFQNYTAQSLILLDEVGRGTSTYDGISIARAMVEYLNETRRGKPKTLFATHYAELAELIQPDSGIFGLTVDVLEEEDKIIFLRKIKEGKADKSYGIYVAELAGMPPEIIQRAKGLLNELENSGLWQNQPGFSNKAIHKARTKPLSENQTLMFDQSTE